MNHEKAIYIDGKYMKYKSFHQDVYQGYKKISFLIEKKYLPITSISINKIIYQHGITIGNTNTHFNNFGDYIYIKNVELHWYTIDGGYWNGKDPLEWIKTDIEYDMFDRGDYVDFSVKGKNEKIDEKAVLREIKINELI